MNLLKKHLIIIIYLLFFGGHLFAQTELDERVDINLKSGLGFYDLDSTVGVNMRFRMQNVFGLTTFSGENLSISEIEARTKRLRLRFDGFIKDKRFKYYMQLAFSRGDIDWDQTQVPHLVRDAIVYYHFTPEFYIGFGQSKLPGNRQRVVSSGALQFIDRSVVNNHFTLDRDFGLFTYYKNNIGTVEYRLKGAVSSGEGRSAITSDKGLAYTGRVEILPLGAFSFNGDYFEGDIYFEEKPKISLGGGYSYNDNATKNMSQRGNNLYFKRDIETVFIDFLFKYAGFSISSEYMTRSVLNPFTVSSDMDTIYVVCGAGINSQVSIMLNETSEIAFRYSNIIPDKKIEAHLFNQSFYTLGYTKYLKMHLLKFQTNLTYSEQFLPTFGKIATKADKWQLLFQVELGI